MTEVGKVRFLADLILSCFFDESCANERMREENRQAALAQVLATLRQNADWPAALVRQVERVRRVVPALHWQLEFPEAFTRPLEKEVLERFDSFVGNPPFAGKGSMGLMNIPRLLPWLQMVHPGTHGNADYCVHFFLRGHYLLGRHGTLGMVATKTIGEGDTRDSGLTKLLKNGSVIYAAQTLLSWPGEAANVTVSLVWLAQGKVTDGMETPQLNGNSVGFIGADITSRRQRPLPASLAANARKSTLGTIPRGAGFRLSLAQRAALVAADPTNMKCTPLFLGGQTFVTSPTQTASECIIDFGDLDEASAQRWSQLYQHVKDSVLPERKRVDQKKVSKNWWLFESRRTTFYEAIRERDQCIVCCRVTKHLAFSMVSTSQVLDSTLIIFNLFRHGAFAVLQSRVHEAWARDQSSTMNARLQYSVSDAFATFPFPLANLDAQPASLDAPGRTFYERRAAYMVATQRGLTATYNAMTDPRERDPRILELRQLTEDMDRAVLAAYGWQDLEVPPYLPPTDAAGEQQLHTFKETIIDRLYALNAQRALEERHPKPKRRPLARPKTAQLTFPGACYG